MEARTKIEKEIETLRGEVSTFEPSEKQIKSAFPHIGIANGKRVFCTECGKAYKEIRTTGHVRCKNCHRTLKLIERDRRVFSIEDYLMEAEVVGRFQVNRFFYLKKSYSHKFGMEYMASEVMQRWISDNGKMVTLAKNFVPMSWESKWCLSSDMSFKKNKNLTSWGYYDRYDIDTDCVIVKGILPVLKERGYNGKDSYNRRTQIGLQADLLNNSKIETLFKCGFTEFVNLSDSAIDGLWGQIKTCMRHQYHLDCLSVGLWLDMINSLDYMGKDIHNPKFICPENLIDSHDFWTNERARKVAKEEAAKKTALERERERKRALAEAKKNTYPQRMAAFLGIFIKGNGFTIRPLQSVVEFQEEGKAMHHCVYANEYYNKDNCLILSVRDKDNNRLSTIEYDLNNFRIVQNRAACNEVPPLFDEINKCIEKHKALFVKAMANSVKSAASMAA